MKYTNTAVTLIRNNNALMAWLMVRFDRGQRTIEIMLDNNDERLLDPEVVEHIQKTIGLYPEQTLEGSLVGDQK